MLPPSSEEVDKLQALINHNMHDDPHILGFHQDFEDYNSKNHFLVFSGDNAFREDSFYEGLARELRESFVETISYLFLGI